VTSEPSDREPTGDSPRGFALGVASLLALGAGLRLALGFESFWLDEAWSHAIAIKAGSALEIFTGFKHDNNHLLNTLYLYLVDDWVGDRHWILFRLLSLVAGCLSIWAVWRIGLQWGRPASVFALALVATSFPLASAAAQARGYAGAILCSLLYFLLVRGGRGQHTTLSAAMRAVGLGLTAIAGLLFHPSFVYGLAGVLALSATDELVSGRGGARGTWRWLRLHGIPLLSLGALYSFHYAQIEVGGGPDYDRFETVRQAFAQTLALPPRGPLAWIATFAGVGLAGLGTWVLIRHRDRHVVLFGVTLVAAPLGVLVVSDPQLYYARYLLATFPWFYLVVAIGLADAWARRGMWRVLAASVLAFFVASNSWHAGSVLTEGRGDYLDTLTYIAANTESEVIEIGGDHDFRNSTVLRFHAPRVDPPRRFVYRVRGDWPTGGPLWILRHSFSSNHTPEAAYEPTPGLRYQLETTFEHGPGDGFQWYIYRRK
jgi:hypothetical protein